MLLLRRLRSAAGPVVARHRRLSLHTLARRNQLQHLNNSNNNGHAAAAAASTTCTAAAAATGPNPTSIHPLDDPTGSLAAALPHLQREVGRFDPALPIERASTPPSSWSVW